MPDDEPSSLRRFAVRIGATFLCLLVLYPVSSGPACFVVTLTGSDGRTLRQVYAPVIHLVEATGTRRHFLVYVRWWVDRAIPLVPKDRVDDPAIR